MLLNVLTVIASLFSIIMIVVAIGGRLEIFRYTSFVRFAEDFVYYAWCIFFLIYSIVVLIITLWRW